MTQLIDIARVSADNAKRIAGGILCSGIGNTQVELLAQAVADLANAVEGLAEHCQPSPPRNQLGQVMPVETFPRPESPFIGPATGEDLAGLSLV